MSKTAERLRIWEQGFSPKAKLAPNIDLHKIAEKYELSGGAIMNAIHFTSLEALHKQTNILALSDLQEGIHRVLRKDK